MRAYKTKGESFEASVETSSMGVIVATEEHRNVSFCAGTAVITSSPMLSIANFHAGEYGVPNYSIFF